MYNGESRQMNVEPLSQPGFSNLYHQSKRKLTTIYPNNNRDLSTS